MLNVFYWYSIIWTAIILLYELNWSNFSTPLDTGLLAFLVISIIISFVFGTIFRPYMEYHKLGEETVKRKRTLTYLVVFFSFLEMFVAKNIPLIFIPLGLKSYSQQDFSGLPIVHVFIVNVVIFYSSYLYYLFLETKIKSLLIEVIALISCLLLMFQKGAIMFCMFCIVNLTIAKLNSENRIKISNKGKVKIALTVILILYLNGCLTNLRSGVAWNDNDFISSVGRLNNNWPFFLPKQFGWTYSYLISPLFNLNNNMHFSQKEDFISLIANILPVSISEYLCPDLIVKCNTIILVSPALNACTGYINPVIVSGNTGLWVMYIVEMVIAIIVASKSRNSKYTSIYLTLMSMIIVFMFFYNTFSYSATSYIFLLMILLPLFKDRMLNKSRMIK